MPKGEAFMKNGLELIREIVTEKYEGESIWDYAWALLMPIGIFLMFVLASVV